MTVYKNYKRIARLIAVELAEGLSAQEQEELDSWKNQTIDNQKLYDQIRNSSNYQSWYQSYQKIQMRDGWEKINHIIRIKKLMQILRYAAAVLFPVLVLAGGIYFYTIYQIKQSQQISQLNEIKPGTTKAVLTLSNGESVLLGASGKDLIKEDDGTLIQRTTDKLDYEKKADRKKDKLIFNTIRTPQGGEYNLVLADGTEVFLNSLSQFKYPVQFVGANREVELIGEAYFIVAKDPKKPFLVKTNGVEIAVAGTSFNINAYEETGKVVTTLVEGKINLKFNNQNIGTYTLSPDEQAVFTASSVSVKVRKVDVSLFTEWRNGRMIFHDNRLEDIMNTLIRWYSIEVFYLDPKVKDIKFSGNLNRYEDISSILDIIQATGKVNIKINKNAILFSMKK